MQLPGSREGLDGKWLEMLALFLLHPSESPVKLEI
jgi:hypothetical protein